MSPTPPPQATAPATGPRKSRRQQNKQELNAKRRANKQNKRSGQERIRDELPFIFGKRAEAEAKQVDGGPGRDQELKFFIEPRVHVCKSKYPPKPEPRARADKPREGAKKGGRKIWAQLEGRPLEDIPHDGDITFAAIPNPNYLSDLLTPRWAAFRIPDSMPPEDQAHYEKAVVELKALGMKHRVSASHGQSFRQSWFGPWVKYHTDTRFSEHRRTGSSKLQAALKALFQDLDRSLTPVAQRIRYLDKPIYNLMRLSHHQIIRDAFGEAAVAEGGVHESWLVKDPDLKRTSTHRNGGMGTMLAISISTGGGTNYHYDDGDDAHAYSIILVLTTPGWLLLPELGYRMQVKPGDMIGFMACQQLHKLELDSANPDATQLVFTFWTDRLANKKANPNAAHDFYVVDQEDSEGGEGE